MPEYCSATSGVTPYRCSTCGKLFSSSSHLRRHEAAHRQSRNNVCIYCGRVYVRHDVLRRHSKSCLKRGEHDAIASAEPGRPPRKKRLCQSKSPQLDQDYQGQPISFLQHYTDPCRDSVVPAFTIARAHAPPAELEDNQQANINGLAGDTTALFGMFSDLFMDNSMESSASRSSAHTPSHLSLLQARTNELHQQLFAHQKKYHTKNLLSGSVFLTDSANAVFNGSNFEDCIWSYFTIFHPQHPFIHWPTFDAHKVQLPLLLAVAFAGSVHCIPRDAALSSRSFFDLAEDFIFEHLRSQVANKNSLKDKVLPIVQAAILIIALQISFNDEVIRRRIRVSRHPELVASVISLGLTMQTHVSIGNASEWDNFIVEESRIRSVHTLYLMDCMNTFFFNTLPQMATSEVQHRMPCCDILFEASTLEDFMSLISSSPQRALPELSIKQLILLLLDDVWLKASGGNLGSLQPRHLMMCIFALHSIFFSSRASLLLSPSYQPISRALSRWKQLWDLHAASQEGLIGFTKYSVEIWQVTRRVLELMHEDNTESVYLNAVPTDSMIGLHEFIKEYTT